MPHICIRVPPNPHTWLVPNAHTYFFVYSCLSGHQLKSPFPREKEILWKDKSKDPCRPLNARTNSKSHSMPNNSFTKMFAKLYISFRSWFLLGTNLRKKPTTPTHTYTAWKITEMAKLVSISYYPAYLNSWYKYRLRVSTLVRCVIRMNKELAEWIQAADSGKVFKDS